MQESQKLVFYALTEPTAQWISSISNWLVIVGAILGGFGTIGLFWSGIANGKFTDFNKERMQVAIARANESAALANQRAEEAGLKAREIEDSVKWRDLTQEQENSMREILQKHPGMVRISFIAGDPESQRFAYYLRRAFHDWDVAMQAVSYSAIISGILVKADSSPEGTAIFTALSTAGISFAYNDIPTPAYAIGKEARPNEEKSLQILVGGKNANYEVLLQRNR